MRVYLDRKVEGCKTEVQQLKNGPRVRNYMEFFWIHELESFLKANPGDYLYCGWDGVFEFMDAYEG